LLAASAADATPDKQAEKIGYLRIGAPLVRSDQPGSLRECTERWNALRPFGFIGTLRPGVGEGTILRIGR